MKSFSREVLMPISINHSKFGCNQTAQQMGEGDLAESEKCTARDNDVGAGFVLALVLGPGVRKTRTSIFPKIPSGGLISGGLEDSMSKG